ncbi:hypothetical protein [Dickeya fangzhongdai]|nr:hypothetical protein [Dickeya fangzhongdai]WOY00930.1 hypothetical protein OGM22_03570 [Dickeya fangzhongdai]WOY03918.1 hypothetical protein OGM21_19070 [Dickeya fangzhongdai]GGB90840.1 hypothetical protein GCM10007171_04870 [Dickeya fangzhongdai]
MMDIFEYFCNKWQDKGAQSLGNKFYNSLDLNDISHGINALEEMRQDVTIAECISILAPEAWFALDVHINLLNEVRVGTKPQATQCEALGQKLSRAGSYLFASQPIDTYRKLYDHFDAYLKAATPSARELSSILFATPAVTTSSVQAPDPYEKALQLISSDKPVLLPAFVAARSILALESLPVTDLSKDKTGDYIKLALEKGSAYVASKGLGAVIGTVSPLTSGGMVLAPWMALSSFSGYMEKQSRLYDMLEIITPLQITNETVKDGLKTAIHDIDIGAMKSAFSVTPFGVLFTAYDGIKKCAELINFKAKDHQKLAESLLTLAKSWNDKSLNRLMCLMLLSNLSKNIGDVITVLCHPDSHAAAKDVAGWLEP